MASSHPKPYRQASAKTVFLRVPAADWSAVKMGVKGEFRASGGQQTQVWNLRPPIAVVAYAVRTSGTHDCRLMVLEKTWREPLGAISPAGLAAEGCKTLAEYKRKWAKQNKRRFPAMKQVQVYQVRPFVPSMDVALFGTELFLRLYGEYVDAGR